MKAVLTVRRFFGAIRCFPSCAYSAAHSGRTLAAHMARLTLGAARRLREVWQLGARGRESMSVSTKSDGSGGSSSTYAPFDCKRFWTASIKGRRIAIGSDSVFPWCRARVFTLTITPRRPCTLRRARRCARPSNFAATPPPFMPKAEPRGPQSKLPVPNSLHLPASRPKISFLPLEGRRR